MLRASSREVSRHLKTLFHCGAAGQLGDEQLLERFVTGRDEVAEAAFAALMDRHGAMVLGVCRRVLGNREAAEDAFQATFMVLVRKAGTISRREQLSKWLYGVAVRAALEARAHATRQQAREKRLGAMRSMAPTDETDTSELRVIVDEELARMPDRYRSAVILCELEGLSRREAAGRLGVAEGTLSSRLARAKARLKDRLTRRGVALSAATLATFLAREAHAVIVPPALAETTIRVAALAAAGSSTAGVVSTSVATLTQGVLKAMLLAKFKGIALGFVTLTLVTTGMTALAQFGGEAGTGPGSPDDRIKAVEQKLDKILEALGGSGRDTTPLPAPRPVPEPIPRSVGAPAAPVPPVPAAAPMPPAALAPSPTPPPSPDIAIHSDGIHGRPVRVPLAERNAVSNRLETVERRLNDLERRLGEMERRLNRTDSGPPPPRN